MALFWDIFYWCIPIFVFLLIPFMTFFYEADDGMLMTGTSIGTNPNNRFCEAMKYEMIVIIIFGGIFIACYLLLGDSSVPVTQYLVSVTDDVAFTTPSDEGSFQTSFLANMTQADFANQELASRPTNLKYETLTMPVSIPTFLSGFMAFFGWFFFALFGGIGLAAVPLDLILGFINRPRRMDPAEFADAQMSIRNKTVELVDAGELLKLERDESEKSGAKEGFFSGLSQQARQERQAFLKFKKEVYLLETDVEEFLASSENYQNYNPIIPYLSLLAGFFCTILSVAWIIQIAIFIAPPKPIHPFLNMYFQWFDSWFPLFGVLSVAIFTLYLLVCAVKGCFKFGIRFMAFQIHPMKVNKTYMSSFMFNVGLVLLCALPVVQFTVTAFPDYARYTHVVNVMGTQVQYLKFFTWFWTNKVFVFALLAVTLLTGLYLMCKPRDRDTPAAKRGVFARLRSRS
jgi:LMBR1 domain-containing protein 1